MMGIIFIIIITLALLCSCSPCERLVKRCPVKDSISYVETVTDDPSYTIPDSLYYRLVFECDSNYNVLLMEFDEHNTGISTETIIKEIRIPYEDKTGKQRLVVEISAQTDSIKTLNRTIEKLRNDVRTVTVEKIVEVPVKKLGRFAKVCIWYSIISWIMVLLYIAYKIFKPKIPFIR